ncbi:MAG TPA: KpsF/GutQ family sugar-phosphate isomerase [bacterium]|nr:KpsF/GutQ family sugar-phosphate isomerase [bacterium]
MSIQKGKEVVRIEAEAVAALIDRIDENFQKAVDILLSCRGRVIITGIGKSGIIAKKIASTLTSTGTAALFLHPAEGLHGDLGAVLKDDVVICISKSGTTDEILRLLPIFKRQGVPIIAMTGEPDSIMAQRSTVVLNIGVKEEACPFDVIPTSSTTTTLVMGDALALAVFQERGFSIEEFAQFHPGGDIGKRLFLKVEDVMRTGDDIARVNEDASLSLTILEITSKRLGATCVLDKTGKLTGIITDGDLRRLMEQRHQFWDLKARDIMSRAPKFLPAGVLAARALHEMEKYSINQLIIVNENGDPVGMIHLHDLLKSGLA